MLSRKQLSRAYCFFYALIGPLLWHELPAIAKNQPRPTIRGNRQAPPAPARIPGFEIEQENKFAGDYHIFVTAYGARLDNAGNGYGLILHNHDKQMIVFNSRLKKYCLTDTDRWVAPFSGFLFLRDGQLGDLRPAGRRKDSFLGMPAVHELMRTTEKFEGLPRSRGEKLQVVSADLVVGPTMPCGKIAAQIYKRLYSLPFCNDFPFSFTTLNRKNSKGTELSTKSIKQLTVDASTFSIPAGYQLCKDSRDLLLDDNGSQVAKDFYDQVK